VQALVWYGPRELGLETVPDPSPDAGEVLLRTAASGICGSEVEGYLGRQSNRVPPLVMGHELAGEVIGLGEGVARSWLGKLVAVNPIISCRECGYCTRGERNLCRRKGLVGIARPGGFAEILSVPVANILALQDGTDPRTGAFVEPMANGVHAARLALDGGAGRNGSCETVVIGCGAIGLCALQALQARGVASVQVVEPGTDRREQATRLGANRVYPDAATARQALGAEDGPRVDERSGADLVIDAVGATSTRQLAVDLCRPQGRVVLMGLHDDESPLAFRPVVRDEVVLSGSYAYTDDDFSTAAQLLQAGAASPGEIGPVRPLSEGPLIFNALAAGEVPAVRVFLGNG